MAKIFTQSPNLDNADVLDLYSKNPTFHSVLRKIAFTVATNKWEIYTNKNKDGEPVKNNPALSLLNKMNRFTPGIQGKMLVSLLYNATGECYIWKMRSGNKPIALYPFPSTWVIEDGDNIIVTLEDISIENSMTLVYPRSDFIILKDPDPAHPFGRGSGFGYSLADEIDAQDKAGAFLRNFFYNDATPPFVVMMDGADETIIKRVETAWLNKLQGYKKSHLPYFMGDKADIVKLGSEFKSMQMDATMRYSRDVIYQTFGIPPEVMGVIENSNRATIESAMAIFYDAVINPELTVWQEAFNLSLMPEFGSGYMSFVNQSPADKDYKLKVMQAFPNNFTQNEVRTMIGYEAVPGGDEFFVEEIPFDDTPEEKPEPAKAIKAVKKTLTDAEVNEILKAISPELLVKSTKDVYKGISLSVIADTLKELGVYREIPYQSEAQAYIQSKVASRIVGITDTTRDQIKRQLDEAIFNDETKDQIKQRIKSVFGEISEGRLNVITQTETHSTVNNSIATAYKQSGVVQYTEWMHHPEESEQPRQVHAEADGQRVIPGMPFILSSGASGDYPGGMGAPEEDINCHCTIGAVVDETNEELMELFRQADYRLARVKRVDAMVTKFSKPMKRSYKEGLKKQENAALAKVDDVIKE